MDEIEFRKAYNEAVDAVKKGAVETAQMLILQLVNALNERIIEIQDSMEDT